MRARYTCTAIPVLLGALLCARSAVAQPADAPSPAPEDMPTVDTEKAEETAAVEEEPDPTRPPPKGKGAVWGVIKSRKDGETLLEALVTVIGRKDYATSDVEGRYRIELPPGTYQLRVQYELHRPARVKNVRIALGKLAKIDVTLDPDEMAVEEVTAVEAEVERASAATQLFLRKNAAQASDSIGAQDIAKAPDRNAADAVKRVVGTTVVDGRYIFVRGLGDRYTNSMLNGSPLPSPEPDRQAVPLDMFPTLVISDLTVSKTFTPDMPGDFAGGSLDIHTRDLPNKFLFQATVGAGFNTLTTFGNRLSYPGGGTDWLGIDDGGRRLPNEVPAQRVTRLLPNGTVNPNLNAVGKAVNGPMEADRAFNLPNGTGSVVVGDSFKLKKTPVIGCDTCVIGYMVGGSYSRRFQKRTDEIVRTFGVSPTTPGQLVQFNDYRAETGFDTVTWSGLGTVSYAVGTDHKVSLTGLYSRNAEKEARRISGFNEEQGADIFDERLRFVNRALAYGQLRGEHRFRKLNTAELRWTALWARATLNDPNLRETVFVNDAIQGLSFRDSTQSGQHFYAAQGETTRSGGLDWTQPLNKTTGEHATKIKAGGLVTLRGRSFNARRFRFLRNPSADPTIFRQNSNQIFTDDNVGPAIELEEWTRPTDSYAAQYNVYAGYLMSDVALTSRLRFVAGERIEVSRQIIQSFDPFAPNSSDRVESKLSNTDLLPSGNFIFKLTEASNIRLTATRTVARPQLRELAPFVFTDFFGAREILGNPALDRTRIINLDARYEVFPRVGEVLAVSLFHKDFNKPIEQVILPTSRGVISYQNAKGAVNTGIEVEGRKGLDLFWDRLKEFSVLANLTVVYSRVNLDTSQIGIQTSSTRPLAGQSPYVVNFALDWNHEKSKTRARILYNIAGQRIAQVGSNGLPDQYEQPRHLVDISMAQGIGNHIDLKGTVENLLNAPVRFTQGEDGRTIANRYFVGSTFWLTATYTN